MNDLRRWPMQDHVSIDAWCWWINDLPRGETQSENMVAEAFANPAHLHHEHAKEITAYFVYRRLTSGDSS